MKRTFSILGALALLAWTALGLFAWSSASGHFQVTVVEAGSSTQETMRALALADQVTALHEDLRALSTALGQNLEALSEELAARQTELAAAQAKDLAGVQDSVRLLAPGQLALQQSLARLQGELELLAQAVREAQALAAAAPTPRTESDAGVPVAEPPAAEALVAAVPPEPAAAPTPAAEAVESPEKKRRSFLAFRLPSEDLRFDERRSWTVLPALSRVGFDAKSTLHDFSGVSSNVQGELEANLAEPGLKPSANVRVQAKTLVTGIEGRDTEMRENLAVDKHAELVFELNAFEATRIDAKARTCEGKASGRMSIRGVARDVEMPVRLSIDEARRLCVEGDMQLDLTQYEVPVPSKLGMISMEKNVKVWISLRLRADPRAEH